jgi:hypothetical protein
MRIILYVTDPRRRRIRQWCVVRIAHVAQEHLWTKWWEYGVEQALQASESRTVQSTEYTVNLRG